MTKIFLFSFLIFLISCEDKIKFTELNSFPEWNEEKFKGKENELPLHIFLVGGFSDGLFPSTELKPNSLPKEMPNAVKVGGLGILASYLKTVRARFPESSLILGLESAQEEVARNGKEDLVMKGLQKLPLDALLLTKRNLPLKSNALPTDADNLLSSLPWLNSNILSIKSGEPIETFNSKPYRIIEKAGTKIGILGITSYNLLNASERNEISGYYFQDPVTTVLKFKNILKKEGANFLIVLFSTKSHCSALSQKGYLFFKDLEKMESQCDKDFEVRKLLDRLPPQSVDLVITDQKDTTATIYRNTPVVSVYRPDKFISGIRLTFERNQINFDHSLVFPQIKLCHQMFMGTHDCIYQTQDEEIDEERFELLEKSAFGLVTSRFLGKEMREDEEVTQILNGR